MNERQIVHVNNGTLVLRKILQSDAGVYNCTVTALDHKFKGNNNANGINMDEIVHTESKKLLPRRKVKTSEKNHHSKNDGYKTAWSSMRIKVIGKKKSFFGQSSVVRMNFKT